MSPTTVRKRTPGGGDPEHCADGDRAQALISCPRKPAIRTGTVHNRRYLPGSHHRRPSLTDGVLHTLFHSDQGGDQQVVLCQDRASGLKAVDRHPLHWAPPSAGREFYPYASEEEAVADALNLSRGMSYKNAMAGLDHGGGKAVIIGDPEQIKSEALLLAYGRLRVLARRALRHGATSARTSPTWTSSRASAAGRRAARRERRRRRLLGPDRLRGLPGHAAHAQHLWGDPTLRGRKVGIAGVGKVGHHLGTICARTAPRS